MSKTPPFLSLLFIPLTLMLALSACTNQFKADVKDSVSKTVKANQEAKSLFEWETSGAHPENIFTKARENDTPENRKEVCDQLSKLAGNEIIIFEEEINKSENAAILEGCKETLQKTIEEHWKKEREEMQKAGMSTVSNDSGFSNTISGGDTAGGSNMENADIRYGNQGIPQFVTEVQYRDLSKGYYAYTGDVKAKQVILTFDDGPDGRYTPVILKALRDSGVKAIFFHCGNRVDARPDLVQAVAKDGHSIGSHTYNHNYLGPLEKCGGADCRKHWLNTENAAATFRQAHQSIINAIGWVDPFFRFPYGAHTPELRQMLKDSQAGEFFWTVDSLDWKAGSSNLQTIQSVMTQLDASKKGIILFHDVQRKTAEIIPQVLRELYNRGYQPVVLQSADPDARLNSKLASDGNLN